MKLCSLVDEWRIREKCCLHLQGRNEDGVSRLLWHFGNTFRSTECHNLITSNSCSKSSQQNLLNEFYLKWAKFCIYLLINLVAVFITAFSVRLFVYFIFVSTRSHVCNFIEPAKLFPFISHVFINYWLSFFFLLFFLHCFPFSFIWWTPDICVACASVSISTSQCLTLRLLMSYIYGAPSKARNANVVYIWTYVWQRWNSLFLFAAQCSNTESMQRVFLCHICV